ncbi:MAG: ABC transporter permease, partial [Candidatus Limisoma sp.]
MCAGLFGGYIVALIGLLPVSTYIFGIQSYFIEWYVWYAIIKSLFFSVIITSVASFYGYYVKGGALEVGKASTNSVVASSVLILLLDVLLTRLLLQ